MATTTTIRTQTIRYPWVMRSIGALGILHAILGLIFGFAMFIVVPQMETMDPSIFEKHRVEETMAPLLERMSEKERSEIRNFNPLQIREIMSSEGFRDFFLLFAVFGILFNLALLFISTFLIRLKAGSVWTFIGLMLSFFLYARCLPYILVGEPIEWHLEFGAAWGIGNSGIAFLLLSFFWLWGPIFALAGRGFEFPDEGNNYVPWARK